MEQMQPSLFLTPLFPYLLVLIIGAGPAGLAMAACLNRQNIPNMVLEREDCYASLWRKRSYDRLKLHLAKEFCELPYLPYPSDAPTFIPKSGFISYLDTYVSHFNITIRYNCSVESAFYDNRTNKWCVEVHNKQSDETEVYNVKFLVVATGENSEGLIPEILGLDSFVGCSMHSSSYDNGERFRGQNVLVVGCGNSGMEIAYDLSEYDVNTSIVARSPVHVVTKEMVFIGMRLLQFLPCSWVDKVMLLLSKFRFGNTSRYGLQRPNQGPFYLKASTGRSPTIDVGAMDKIKSGEIQVFPSITSINGNEIYFEDGRCQNFDAIVFATGYRSTVNNWLQDNDLFNDNGMPSQNFPNHWKGRNGIYCVGFSSRGLMGISSDAQNIANDISYSLSQETN